MSEDATEELRKLLEACGARRNAEDDCPINGLDEAFWHQTALQNWPHGYLLTCKQIAIRYPFSLIVPFYRNV